MSEPKERGGAGWDEVPAWMQRLRARAVAGARELAREQMKRRKARFEVRESPRMGRGRNRGD